MSVLAFICLEKQWCSKIVFLQNMGCQKKTMVHFDHPKRQSRNSLLRLQQAVAGADFRSISNPLSESNPSYMA